jgi:hypothetical protein
MQHVIGLASYAPQIYTGVWEHLAAAISMATIPSLNSLF